MSNFEVSEATVASSKFSVQHSLFEIRFCIVLALAVANGGIANAEVPSPQRQPSGSLADAFARIVADAIPREYQKEKDWGNTKKITSGLRRDGLKLYRRKKPVNHGVWKRYRVRLVDPNDNLAVHITHVQPGDDGRLRFTLQLQAALDLWARAKVYQYGIHIVALEAEGDAKIELGLDCEIGMRLQTKSGSPGVALDPRVIDARLDIVDFHLERVSNAKGPIIRELGEELPSFVKDQLQGPKFVGKLNRAIEKKRDRLEIGFNELWK